MTKNGARPNMKVAGAFYGHGPVQNTLRAKLNARFRAHAQMKSAAHIAARAKANPTKLQTRQTQTPAPLDGIGKARRSARCQLFGGCSPLWRHTRGRRI